MMDPAGGTAALAFSPFFFIWTENENSAQMHSQATHTERVGTEATLRKMKSKSGAAIGERWLVLSRTVLLLCACNFGRGMLFADRAIPDIKSPVVAQWRRRRQEEELSEDFVGKTKPSDNRDMIGEVAKAHEAIHLSRYLDKSIATLQMELAARRSKHDLLESADGVWQKKKKAFVVIGINTAFSRKKLLDPVRETLMPQGEKLKKLEEEKGVVIRFMIRHRV